MDEIEKLLEAPYWIIDILPMQVPKDSPGQYFAVEEYFRKERHAEIRRKHLDLVLKLNCYLDMKIGEEVNPSPARIAEIMNGSYVCIMTENAMIQSDPEDTYMTVFNPGERLLELIQRIAAGEGLFVWKGKP